MCVEGMRTFLTLIDLLFSASIGIRFHRADRVSIDWMGFEVTKSLRDVACVAKVKPLGLK